MDTIRITKVKRHGDEGMVRDGGVRELDRFGNNAADEAADFGRRRVDLPIIDARRNFAGVCGVLHRFFIAISRDVVNHVDGASTALDPLVWSADGEWIALLAALITADDVGTWPYSVGILVKWVAFSGSLHWRRELILGSVACLLLKC